MQIEKLSREAFDAALHRGLGRALLHVKCYGDEGIEDLIENALVSDYSYDMQLEGTRSDWLLDILRHTGRMKSYAQYLLQRYAEVESIDRNLIQQIEIASNLFDFGFEEFRPIVINKYRALKSVKSTRPSRATEVIYCCGLPGLALAASLEVPENSEADDSWSLDFNCAEILDNAESFLDDGVVRRALLKWSDKSKAIRRFKEATDRQNQNKIETHDASKSDESISKIDIGKIDSVGAALKFARTASDSEVQLLFNELLRCEDIKKQQYYLAVFRKRELPEVNNQIIALLDSPDKKVRRATVQSLSMICSPVIREIALRYLRSNQDERIEHGFTLLISNYQTEDIQEMELALKRIADKNHLHWAGMSLQDIAEQTADVSLAPILLFLYVNGPDPYCRDGILKMLLDWHLCPDHILHEAQWDSYWSVQALARGRLSRNLADLQVEGLDFLQNLN